MRPSATHYTYVSTVSSCGHHVSRVVPVLIAIDTMKVLKKQLCPECRAVRDRAQVLLDADEVGISLPI